MNQFNIDPDELADQIETRLKREKNLMRGVFLGINAGMFVLFNVLAWSFVGSAGVGELSESAATSIYAALFLMAVGWGVGLLYHLIMLAVEHPNAERQMRSRIASRLVGEQVFQHTMRRVKAKTKAKRTPADLHDLIDDPDGLYDSDEDMTEAEPQRARRR